MRTVQSCFPARDELDTLRVSKTVRLAHLYKVYQSNKLDKSHSATTLKLDLGQPGVRSRLTSRQKSFLGHLLLAP